MVGKEEDERGDWMKIAHTTIITRMIQCLEEWEDIHTFIGIKSQEREISKQENDWRAQKEQYLAEGVVRE